MPPSPIAWRLVADTDIEPQTPPSADTSEGPKPHEDQSEGKLEPALTPSASAPSERRNSPMSMSKRVLGPLGIALLCWSQQAIAFECPRIEKTGPGILQETKRDEQALSQMFTAGDVEDEIGVAVTNLQKRYPKASDTELVNYLIGAYCPVVASMSDLSDAQKTSRVEHFAATVFELLAEQKL